MDLSLENIQAFNNELDTQLFSRFDYRVNNLTLINEVPTSIENIVDSAYEPSIESYGIKIDIAKIHRCCNTDSPDNCNFKYARDSLFKFLSGHITNHHFMYEQFPDNIIDVHENLEVIIPHINSTRFADLFSFIKNPEWYEYSKQFDKFIDSVLSEGEV